MPTLRWKVCCIQDARERDLAIAAGADLLGFVGRGCSGPEVIDDDDAIGALARDVPAGVAATLLVRGTDPDEIIDRARRARAAVLQLIDPLPPEVHRHLRDALPGVRRLAVVHVIGTRALAEARAVAPLADGLVLDSGSPADGVFGGTGQTHDWSLSARIVADTPGPVWLAGGLRADNVAEAVATVKPWGIDVCSGVRRDGRLDPERLSAFRDALQALV